MQRDSDKPYCKRYNFSDFGNCLRMNKKINFFRALLQKLHSMF